MTDKTDTPMTDAVFEQYTDPYGALTPTGIVALLDLAVSLERQLAEAKADSERLDWLIEGKWEVYPSGRKYCIAHDIYDAVYGPDLRQAIDKAREESE